MLTKAFNELTQMVEWRNNLPPCKGSGEKLYTNLKVLVQTPPHHLGIIKELLVNRLSPLVDYLFYFLGFIFHQYEMARLELKPSKTEIHFVHNSETSAVLGQRVEIYWNQLSSEILFTSSFSMCTNKYGDLIKYNYSELNLDKDSARRWCWCLTWGPHVE